MKGGVRGKLPSSAPENKRVTPIFGIAESGTAHLAIAANEKLMPTCLVVLAISSVVMLPVTSLADISFTLSHTLSSFKI